MPQRDNIPYGRLTHLLGKVAHSIVCSPIDVRASGSRSISAHCSTREHAHAYCEEIFNKTENYNISPEDDLTVLKLPHAEAL